MTDILISDLMISRFSELLITLFEFEIPALSSPFPSLSPSVGFSFVPPSLLTSGAVVPVESSTALAVVNTDVSRVLPHPTVDVDIHYTEDDEIAADGTVVKAGESEKILWNTLLVISSLTVFFSISRAWG